MLDSEFALELQKTKDLAESNAERLDKMEKRQDDLDELVSTVKVLAYREESVEKDVKEIKKDVKALTEKPAKRWDGLVEKIILAVAAGVVGFILSQIGF